MRFFLIHRPRLKEIAYHRRIKNRIRKLVACLCKVWEMKRTADSSSLAVKNQKELWIYEKKDEIRIATTKPKWWDKAYGKRPFKLIVRSK